MANVEAHAARRPAPSAMLFAVGAGVLLPAVFLVSASDAYEPARVVFVMAILLYAVGHLTALLAAGTKAPVQGIFWLFVYTTFGVAPLAQLVTGQSQRVMDSSLLPVAYGLVLVGLVSYDVGLLLAHRRPARTPRAATDAGWRPTRTLSLRRLRLLSFASTAIVLAAVAQRGLASFFSSRQESAAALDATLGNTDGLALRGIVSATTEVPQVIALMAWILVIASQRRTQGRSTLEARLWAAGLAALTFITNNIWTSSRFWLLAVSVAVFFVIPWATAALYRTALIGGTAGAVLAFPLSDVFRLSTQDRALYGFESRGVIENLAVKDYDQMVMIANGFWYSAQEGLHYGFQMLGNILFWIPRAVWSGKPIDTGVQIGQAMGASNTNLSSPIWFEFYIDFGWVGTIVGMAAIGYFSLRADRIFATANASFTGQIGALQVLVPLIAGYQFILLRGPLLQATGKVAIILLIVWMLFPAVRAAREGKERTKWDGKITPRQAPAPEASPAPDTAARTAR